MNNKDFTNLLPDLFLDSIRKQLMIGALPVATVKDLLHPLFENYNQIFPKLSASLQYEVKIILSLYPEIIEEYEIKDIVTLKYLIYSKYKSLRNNTIRFKRNILKRYKNMSFESIYIKPFPIKRKRLAWAVVYSCIIIVSGLLFNKIMYKDINIISPNDLIYQISEYSNDKMSFSLDDNQKQILAFSSAESENANISKLGFLMASLEIIINKDKPEQIHTILNMIEKNIEPYTALSEPFSNFKANFRNLNINKLQEKFESFFKQKKSLESYRLGEWCAIAKAVIFSKNISLIQSYFQNKERIKTIKNYLDKIDAPKSASNKIQNIFEITKKYRLDEKDYHILNKYITKFQYIILNQ